MTEKDMEIIEKVLIKFLSEELANQILEEIEAEENRGGEKRTLTWQ